MTDRELLRDTDGENRAVRSFLMQYSCDRSIKVDTMRQNMERSGWKQHPTWSNNNPEHLNKAMAQAWLRFLFALENKTTKDNNE